jgi:hypothetical protein
VSAGGAAPTSPGVGVGAGSGFAFFAQSIGLNMQSTDLSTVSSTS